MSWVYVLYFYAINVYYLQRVIYDRSMIYGRCRLKIRLKVSILTIFKLLNTRLSEEK